jgi:hypothetical protein
MTGSPGWRRSRPGGARVPSTVIKARTRQAQRFLASQGRLPRDVFEMEAPPAAAGVLPLAACDRQQATLERSAPDLGWAMLRLQLPVRPDPRGYRDWTWVTLPLILPPTVPPAAVLHLPTLRVTGGRVRADLAFTHAVPAARRDGHTVAIGIDWGVSTLLSAGAVCLHPDGTITALGTGAQYRAAGVLAKAHRLRRHGERLHAKTDRYEKLGAGHEEHRLPRRPRSWPGRPGGSASAGRTSTTPWPGQLPAGPSTRRSPPGPASSTSRTSARWRRAARRDQGATTTSSTPVTRPHRARGAALGAGFHLNAHATPPRREPIPPTPGLTEDH